MGQGRAIRKIRKKTLRRIKRKAQFTKTYGMKLK